MWTQGKNGHHTVNQEVHIPRHHMSIPLALVFPASRPVRNTCVSVVSNGALTIASQLDQDVSLRRSVSRAQTLTCSSGAVSQLRKWAHHCPSGPGSDSPAGSFSNTGRRQFLCCRPPGTSILEYKHLRVFWVFEAIVLEAFLLCQELSPFSLPDIHTQPLPALPQP